MNVLSLKSVLPSLLVLLILSACSSTETLQVHQDQTEIQVDGSLTHWPVTDALIHNSETFDFYTTQDEDHLYIFVNFKSPFYNHAVENSGFILYLGGEDKDSRNRKGIAYPTGAFNQLRADAGAYRELLRDEEWLYSPQNQQRLESMQENNFDEFMLVERFDDGTDAQYGALSIAQLEAQGMEIAAERGQRYYSLEYKIPLNGAPPFDLIRGNTYWLGFAIEPPDFNFRDSGASTTNQGYGYGQRRRQPSSSDRRMYMRRQMGDFNEWFRIEIQ